MLLKFKISCEFTLKNFEDSGDHKVMISVCVFLCVSYHLNLVALPGVKLHN